MFDGDATNMLRPSDRRNAQNRRRRGGHRSFELLMGAIVWIKRYTGPFYVALDNICTIGSIVSAFGHTWECENHCAKLRTDARKRAGLKVCFVGFEDDVASIRMFYSMSNHIKHQENGQEISHHHRI